MDGSGITGSGVPDGVLYHGRHDVSELIGRAGHTPAIPLVTALLLSIVLVDDTPYSTRERSRSSCWKFVMTGSA